MARAGRPRADANAIDTTERILQAATEQFAQSGVRGARLEDIASAAGIRRPSLLYHFKSKKKLYEAVIQRAFDALGAALTQTMGLSGDFPTRCGATADRYQAFLAAEPQFARLVLREILDGDGPGRELLLTRIAPLLDLVIRFFEEEGSEHLRPGVPVRGAILQIAMSGLVREAAGALQEPLWGSGTEAEPGVLARRLLLRG